MRSTVTRHVLDTRAPEAAQKLQSLAMGQLAGAIDLVGMPATVGLALAALRKGGRTVELHADLPGHDSPALWQRQSGNLLRFYAAALKRCTGRNAA
mgnify:CR=1 FL=1